MLEFTESATREGIVEELPHAFQVLRVKDEEEVLDPARELFARHAEQLEHLIGPPQPVFLRKVFPIPHPCDPLGADQTLLTFPQLLFGVPLVAAQDRIPQFASNGRDETLEVAL